MASAKAFAGDEIMFKKIKKSVALLMAGALMLGSLAGCGSSGTGSNTNYSAEEASTLLVMNIGDYEIYMDEMMIYVLQMIYVDGYTSDALAEDQEDAKEEALSLIRENKIIYDVACHNDVELDDNSISVVETSVESFMERFADIVDDYGITEDVVRQVMTEQATVSKFENDIQNEMGQTINDDIAAGMENYSFHSAYYMVFPTVEVNDDNEPMTDDDGEYVYLSDEDKADVLANVIEAVTRLRSGEDYEAIAEEYGITDYCSERTGYVGYSEDDGIFGCYTDSTYNEALYGLSAGDCSDIIETSVGYTVTYMITADDEDLKANYIYSIASDYLDDEFETLTTTWLSTIEVDTEGDMNGSVWENFDLSTVAKSLEDAGII